MPPRHFSHAACALAWTLMLMLGASTLHAQQPAAGPAASGPTQDAVPVIVGRATEATNTATTEVVGTGLAQKSVTLYPAAAGEVAALGFKTGDRVRAGQVLLRLVDRAQRLDVQLAAARVDAARALTRRHAATLGTGAVPGSLVDDAVATLRQAEIELAQAREALTDRTVRAPFAGVVGLAGVEPGDRVSLDTPLTTLDDRRHLSVAFEVPEALLSRLVVGQPLKVLNPAYPGRTFDGTLAEIDSRVDPSTRNVRLRARVPNPDDLLRSGMSFQVQLTLPGARFISVPELALQWSRDGARVWVVRGRRAVAVPVRSVSRAQGRVLVDGPVRSGETVVVEGVQRLRDGRPVRLVGQGDAK